MQQKCTLQLLAHAAGDDDDDSEHRRLRARREKILKGIHRNRVQPRREPLHRGEHRDGDRERQHDERHAEHDLTSDRPPPEKDVARTFAVRAEKKDHQSDQERRVRE